MEFSHSIHELNKDEIRLSGTKYGASIILRKEMCLWIINTLRSATLEDYYTEGKEWETKEFGDELYSLSMNTDFFVRSTPYSQIEIYPCWKDEKKRTAPVVIPYNKIALEILMSEFIEPVLRDLEKYVPECDKPKIVKPWDINISREEFDRKVAEHKKNNSGGITLKYVGEISPDELFK